MIEAGPSAPEALGSINDAGVNGLAEREVVLELAAEIVSAHVRNSTVPTDQLLALIQQVFNTLSTVRQA